jgi:HSP90 family molecular chaperone
VDLRVFYDTYDKKLEEGIFSDEERKQLMNSVKEFNTNIAKNRNNITLLAEAVETL